MIFFFLILFVFLFILYAQVLRYTTLHYTTLQYADKKETDQTFRLGWEKIYLLPFKTLYTKLREFQYKLLNIIIYTNGMLFKFRKIDSPSCYFCEDEPETLDHFFFYCLKVRAFWEEVNLLLNLGLGLGLGCAGRLGSLGCAGRLILEIFYLGFLTQSVMNFYSIVLY